MATQQIDEYYESLAYWKQQAQDYEQALRDIEYNTIMNMTAEIEQLKAENNRLTYELDKSRSDHMAKYEQLKSKLAKAKSALEYYADDFNWLYNQIKKSDCEEIKFNHVLKKPVPKGLEFEAGGKTARQALKEIGEG